MSKKNFKLCYEDTFLDFILQRVVPMCLWQHTYVWTIYVWHLTRAWASKHVELIHSTFDYFDGSQFICFSYIHMMYLCTVCPELFTALPNVWVYMTFRIFAKHIDIISKVEMQYESKYYCGVVLKCVKIVQHVVTTGFGVPTLSTYVCSPSPLIRVLRCLYW
jgi:hypothetical protein